MTDPRSAPVSVVIPFYRGGATIQRTVASLDAQSVRPAEIVIVNDGPPDRVPSLKTTIPVRVIEHPENRGIPAARNTGVRAASGTWVGFLDQDDEWPRERLERQLAVAARAPAGAVVFGRLHHTGPGHRPWSWPPMRALPHLERGGDAALRALIRWGNALPIVGLLIPRDVLVRLPLDERLRGGADDYEYVLRLVAEGVPFVYDGGAAHEHAAVHHFTGSNYSAHAPRWLDDDIRLLNDLAERYPLIARRRDEALAQVHYTYARHHDRLEELDEARRHYRETIRLDAGLIRPRLALARLRMPGPVRRAIERAWEAAGL